MADFTTPVSNAGSIQGNAFPVKPAVAFALAALADWLFYGQRIGISVVLFAIALACGALLANFARLDRKQVLLAGILVLAGFVPAVEEFNAASLLFIALALGVGLLLTTNRKLTGVGEQAAALGDLYLIGPFRLLRDAAGVFSLPALARGFTVWFIPAVLGSIFAFLFASANPVIAMWIGRMNPGDASSYLNISRVLFWVAALSIVWPFIQVWWRRKPEPTPDLTETVPQVQETTSDKIDFFGAASILRSLILFNLLFAIQTALDVAYLWGNATLPADVSYAAYAHRGAYPLILTALLAAGFVLAAMNPGGPAERSKVIRPLVYLWVGQNVLLVASSILRLDLYVQIYLLTWWRVAAFIWMLLVAFGLLLIVARIVLNRSNKWLVRANLITLTAALYICSLVNFPAVIADYNVDHSREVSGKGIQIDMNYLVHLGTQALPAIDRAIQLRGADPTLVSRRNCLVEQQRNDMASWRAWGFRSWRLQRTLDGQQKSSAAS
jgi:MFS family permease